MKNDARIFASLAQNSNPVPVISIDNLPRFTPLFMARRSAIRSNLGVTPYLDPLLAARRRATRNTRIHFLLRYTLACSLRITVTLTMLGDAPNTGEYINDIKPGFIGPYVKDAFYAQSFYAQSLSLAPLGLRLVRDLLWRHALDLSMPVWPNNDALEGDAAGFAAGRIRCSCERVRLLDLPGVDD